MKLGGVCEYAVCAAAQGLLEKSWQGKRAGAGLRLWDVPEKIRELLSSRTGMSWSPLSGLKGVKPPLVFGGRTTWLLEGI